MKPLRHSSSSPTFATRKCICKSSSARWKRAPLCARGTNWLRNEALAFKTHPYRQLAGGLAHPGQGHPAPRARQSDARPDLAERAVDRPQRDGGYDLHLGEGCYTGGYFNRIEIPACGGSRSRTAFWDVSLRDRAV